MPSFDIFGDSSAAVYVAFGTGCTAAWGFITAFVSGPVTRALKRRIAELEADREQCHDRMTSLEALLFFHGGGELRQAMQKSLSEEHLERIREAQK